jgi:chromosome segregation ATPase
MNSDYNKNVVERETLKRKLDELDEKITTQESTSEWKNARIRELECEVKTLREQKVAFDLEYNVLKKKKTAQDTRLIEYDQEVNSLREKVESQRKEVNTLRSELEPFRKEASDERFRSLVSGRCYTYKPGCRCSYCDDYDCV